MPATTFQLDTTQRSELVDVTDRVARLVKQMTGAGAVLVSSMHTTAAITVNEGYDPDVASDLSRALAALAERDDYRHAEGNSDSHLKVALVGASQLVPVADGELALALAAHLLLRVRRPARSPHRARDAARRRRLRPYRSVGSVA